MLFLYTLKIQTIQITSQVKIFNLDIPSNFWYNNCIGGIIMRLWSLHPSLLDCKALVSCWREALLAKHVLEGKTKGYKNHSQLIRFKATPDPVRYINYYLSFLYLEACKRGYNFDRTKFEVDLNSPLAPMPVNAGQAVFEMEHLRRKCEIRDIEWFKKLPLNIIAVHPMFNVVDGPVESWEVL